MSEFGEGWELDVDRGPDWVFVKVKPPPGEAETPALAERVWEVLRRHLTYRVVLEMDQVTTLRSYVIGQLAMLSKRVHGAGGTLRLTGLSPDGQEVLRICRLDKVLPNYADRQQAVKASRQMSFN